MNRILFLATALFLIGRSISHAHPGHGTTPPDSVRHYVVEPVHGLPLLLLVGAVVTVSLAYQWQRKR
jgi:hypothetical protein